MSKDYALINSMPDSSYDYSAGYCHRMVSYFKLNHPNMVNSIKAWEDEAIVRAEQRESIWGEDLSETETTEETTTDQTSTEYPNLDNSIPEDSTPVEILTGPFTGITAYTRDNRLFGMVFGLALEINPTTKQY